MSKIGWSVMRVSAVTVTGSAIIGSLITAVLAMMPSYPGVTVTLKVIATEVSNPTSPCSHNIIPLVNTGFGGALDSGTPYIVVLGGMVSTRVTSEAVYAPVLRILRLYSRITSSGAASVGVPTLVERVSLGYPTGGGRGPAASTLSARLRARATTVATMRIPIRMTVINWIAFLSFVLITSSYSCVYCNGIRYQCKP